MSAALPTAASAGNLIAVYVVWSNAGAVTVSDSHGNAYAPAGSPTAWSGGASAEVFYAKAVGAGATTITASFASSVAFGIVYAHEYSGLDPANPLDATSAATGTGTALDSGAAVTTGATDLLFGAGASVGAVSSGGTSYTVRSLAEGNLTEDRLVTGAGSYHATAAQGGGGWVMQLVAFRAAQTSGDTTAPSLAIQSPASGATVSGTVVASGTASDNVGVTKVEWALDAGSYATASGTATWSFSLDTTRLGNGNHTLTVRATDAAGNAGSATVAIVASNTTTATGWPDASNTGVPAGVTLHACPTTITATGTYDACLFSGGVSVRANNVTITRSLITGQVDAGDGAQQSGLVIADSTINCNCLSTDTEHSPAAISYSNFTLQRVNISNSAHGAALGSNVVIQDSYIHDLGGNTEAHKDGIYVGDGTQVTLRHNSIECSDGPVQGCTAAIGLLTDFSDITFFTIDHNLLNTNGSYCLYGSGGPQKQYRSNNIAFTNNHFGRKDHPNCGELGPVAYFDITQPGMVWSGNVWDDTGEIVPPEY